MPLAHLVECRADKQVVLDDRFIPTVLHARAAAAAGDAHDRAARPAASARRSAERAGDGDRPGRRGGVRRLPDAAGRSTASSRCLRTTPIPARCIPRSSIEICVSAAGELATFTTTSKRPPKFPGYRHERLRESFEPVIASLRGSLSVVLEQNAIAIPLESKKFGISVAIVTDRTLYSTAVFILAARADLAVGGAATPVSGAAQNRSGREGFGIWSRCSFPACRWRRFRSRRGRFRFMPGSRTSSSIKRASSGSN